MQELYDQRVLHSILGVKPLPTVVKHVQTDEEICHKPNSPSSKRQASRIVEDAWEERRQSLDYTYDESPSRFRQHHRVADEEGGRYGIVRHPPKKRRKTGRTVDDHLVIFVDDDDEEDRHGYDNPEEGEYQSDEGDVDKYTSYYEKRRNERRRSYWLSKGIGPESVDDDITY